MLSQSIVWELVTGRTTETSCKRPAVYSGMCCIHVLKNLAPKSGPSTSEIIAQRACRDVAGPILSPNLDS